MKTLSYIIHYYLYNSKNQIETQRLTEKWFNKNKLSEEWIEFNEYFIDKEKLYNFIIDYALQEVVETNSSQKYNICIHCGNVTKFLGLKHGYKKYCSKSCAAKHTLNLEKQKQTMLEKYGVQNAFQMESTRRSCNSEEAIAKKNISYKQTCLEKYGVETILILPEYRNDHLRNYKEIVETIKNSNLVKYGVEWNSQIKEVKSKQVESMKLTNLDKYGHEYSIASTEIKNKIRETNIMNDNWLPDESVSDFQLYCRVLGKLQTVHNNSIKLLENFQNRGVSNDKYHLDHKYSKRFGFSECILPYYISHICNLEFILGIANRSKNKKCSLEKEELFKMIDAYDKNYKHLSELLI